jgi:hypothetical protein
LEQKQVNLLHQFSTSINKQEGKRSTNFNKSNNTNAYSSCAVKDLPSVANKGSTALIFCFFFIKKKEDA